MRVFFTGCTHFGHANIIKLADRPFSSVQEMDDEMERRWRAVVSEDDVVYHLGDVSYRAADRGATLARLRRLPGYKVVILGNHDDPYLLNDAGWSIVGHYKELEGIPDLGLVVAMHYRIASWNGHFRGSVHLHAHDHLKNPVDREDASPSWIKEVRSRHFDPRVAPRPKARPYTRCRVGADAWAFAPVSTSEIAAALGQSPPDHMWSTCR